MKKLTFKTEKRKPLQLSGMKGNPRKSSAEQKQRLRDSLAKFGLAEIPVIDTDNTIVAGHERVRELTESGKGKQQIDVRVASRKMTDKEKKRYNVLSNLDYGVWDDAKLAEHFTKEELIEWGFLETELADQTVQVDHNPIKDQLQTYIEGDRKQIVMFYELDEYEFTIERIMDIVRREKLKTAKDALLFLIENYA